MSEIDKYITRLKVLQSQLLTKACLQEYKGVVKHASDSKFTLAAAGCQLSILALERFKEDGK